MTRYTIRFERNAEKQFDAIRDVRLAAAIRDAINALADNPRPPRCVKMVGKLDEWRIRVGTWRVVYRIDDGVLVVEVVRVAPRGEVYRGL